jgi:hypothetical protein
MPKSLAELVTAIVAGPTKPTRILFPDEVLESLYYGVWPSPLLTDPPISGSGITWLGAWDSGTLYLEGDAVEHLGSSYIAILENTNSEPPSVNWDLLAAKGDDGETGATGPQGDPGEDGATGPPGPNTVTTATTTNITGLLKGNGSVVSAAVAPTDFVATGDSRLSDARTPLAHTHPQSDVTNLVSDLAGKQPLDSDLTTIAGLTATTDNFMVAAASAWASRTPAQAKTSLVLVKADVGLGNVDNTSDANKPISTATQTALDTKAATNQKLDDFGATDDNTDLNASTAKHGLMQKYPGGTSTFLRADGSFAAPTASIAFTEVEIDFGSSVPVFDKQFTITDAGASLTSKIIVMPSGKVATGRVGDDWGWDSLMLAALPGTGNFVVTALAVPGPIKGKRTIQYTIA